MTGLNELAIKCKGECTVIREKELMEQLDISLSLPGYKRFSILMVAGRLEVFGGLETYIYCLCKELISKGHSVILDCTCISPAMKKIFDFVRVLENLDEQMVGKVVTDEKIEVIHAHPFEPALRALTLHQLTGVPFVITWHGVYQMERFQEIAAEVEKIICVSEEVYDMLLQNYQIIESKLVIVQNGVDIQYFKPSVKSGSPGEILFIGRGGHDRVIGLKTLIDGFLKSDFKRLKICGFYNLDTVEESERIKFLGDLEDVRSHIWSAELVVATGRGVREALACGKPCIVMSNWGYDGLVTPGLIKKQEYANYSGRGICGELSVESVLADLNLLTSKQLRMKLGVYGRRIAEANYDISSLTQKIETIYQKAVENSRLPTVSVILPVYNHADMVGQCLDTLLNQTFRDFELLIINDGSTDNLEKVIFNYQDDRIRYFLRLENKGLPKTLNQGLMLSRGKYITWTSADNLHLPQYIEKLVHALESHPECGSAYSDYIQIDEEGQYIQTMSKGVYQLNGKVNYGPSFLYRSEVVNRVGLFDEALFGTEDRDYSIRMAAAAPVFWLPEILYKYRMHDRSLTGDYKNKRIDFDDSIRHIQEKWKWLPDTQEKPLEDGKKIIYGTKKILLPDKDCTVGSGWTTNLDFDPIFLGKFQKTVYRHFMWFNLDDISREQLIMKAFLQLFCIRNDNTEKVPIAVHNVENRWKEKTIHWGNKPQISDEPSAQVVTQEVYGWMTFDITGLVQSWADRTNKNHGLCIKMVDEQSGLLWAGYNRHFYNKAARPRLLVELTGKGRCIIC